MAPRRLHDHGGTGTEPVSGYVGRLIEGQESLKQIVAGADPEEGEQDNPREAGALGTAERVIEPAARLLVVRGVPLTA